MKAYAFLCHSLSILPFMNENRRIHICIFWSLFVSTPCILSVSWIHYINDIFTKLQTGVLIDSPILKSLGYLIYPWVQFMKKMLWLVVYWYVIKWKTFQNAACILFISSLVLHSEAKNCCISMFCDMNKNNKTGGAIRMCPYGWIWHRCYDLITRRRVTATTMIVLTSIPRDKLRLKLYIHSE